MTPKQLKKSNFAVTCTQFWKELKSECTRISWGDSVHLKQSVRMILLSIVAFGMGTYLADLVLQNSLQLLRSLLLLIFV